MSHHAPGRPKGADGAALIGWWQILTKSSHIQDSMSIMFFSLIYFTWILQWFKRIFLEWPQMEHMRSLRQSFSCRGFKTHKKLIKSSSATLMTCSFYTKQWRSPFLFASSEGSLLQSCRSNATVQKYTTEHHQRKKHKHDTYSAWAERWRKNRLTLTPVKKLWGNLLFLVAFGREVAKGTK